MFQPPPDLEIPATSAFPMFGSDRQGRYVLGVIAKRSYTAVASGECVPASEPGLLNFEPVEDPAHGDLILADTDLWLDKLLTDVVVCGHAWNHPRAPSFTAAVQVGRHPPKRVLVHGPRRCSVTATGRLAFSTPQTVDQVPLSYAMAYGGADLAAEARIGLPELELIAGLPEDERAAALAHTRPFRYPRNAAGRGFLVDDTPEAIDALELPQLEDPDDLLTPERLVVRDPWHWPLQPLPASLDWLGHGLFPRLGWFGLTPDWDPEDIDHLRPAFPELRLGHARPELFELSNDPQKSFDRLALQGASLGLRLGPLAGNERVTLQNLHAQLPSWTVQLPGQRPRLAVDDRQGGLTRLDPRLHTVLIEPDRFRVTLVWAGFGPARRPYMPHELAKMPFLAEW